jgi:hypothetical protein
MKIKMKNNFPTIPLALSLIFFIIFSASFVFLYKKIHTDSLKREADWMLWRAEEEKRNNLQALGRLLKNTEEERSALETHFAKSSDVVPFLDTIEKLAPKVGAIVEIDSVNPSVDGTTLLVGAEVSGSFEAVYRFILLLENSPYELEFLAIDLHRRILGEESIDSQWGAFLELKLLSYLP